MAKFDKDFTKRLVGEDLETTLDDLVRKSKPPERAEPIELITGRTKEEFTLAGIISKNRQKSAVEAAQATSWEEWDAARSPTAIDTILDLGTAFIGIVANLRDFDLYDPVALKEIIDEFRSRLGKIKVKSRNLGQLVLDENASNDDYIVRVLRKRGVSDSTIKQVIR